MSSLLHQRKRSEASLSDEYATPLELYTHLCETYKVYPNLDVCATPQNKKCEYCFTKESDALKENWISFHPITEVFCNPPHSQTEQFVRKAYDQWMKNNITIMMIIPTNTMSSNYWHQCIQGNAEFHPIKGRIRFLVNGKPSDFASRNAYVCVIWRKRNEI